VVCQKAEERAIQVYTLASRMGKKKSRDKSDVNDKVLKISNILASNAATFAI